MWGVNGFDETAGARALFVDLNFEAGFDEIVSGYQSRETRADDVDCLHPVEAWFLQRLRKHLWPLFLLPQPLIEKHASVAEEWTPSLGKDQTAFVDFDQPIAD